MEKSAKEEMKAFDTYHIRMVQITDLEEVTAVEAACFPPSEGADRETIKERLRLFPESFFVAVSEMDGCIIGFVNGCVTDSPALPDELYHDASLHKEEGEYQTIFGLDVLPSYRRQGVAAALMAYMIQKTKERGKKGLVLTCKDHLIPYYEKFGYVNQGCSASTHGGAAWNDMVLLF